MDPGLSTYVISSSYLTILQNASLNLLPGTVVKGGTGYGIFVTGDLRVLRTSAASLFDDTIGGDTDNDGGTRSPLPGDWVGITTASIDQSSIFANPVYGVAGTSTSTPVDATGNWWGSASGPAPIGTGDAINSTTCSDGHGGTFTCYYVNAVPFLTSSPSGAPPALIAARE